MAFLRFTCRQLDERTGQPQGIMSAVYNLLRSEVLTVAETDELRGHVGWIERHLPIPTKFSRTRNVSHKETHGISWLKPTADDSVARFYAIAEILERHGYNVEAIRSSRPGYVVYEDEFQVVAEPFHGENRRV